MPCRLPRLPISDPFASSGKTVLSSGWLRDAIQSKHRITTVREDHCGRPHGISVPARVRRKRRLLHEAARFSVPAPAAMVARGMHRHNLFTNAKPGSKAHKTEPLPRKAMPGRHTGVPGTSAVNHAQSVNASVSCCKVQAAIEITTGSMTAIDLDARRQFHFHHWRTCTQICMPAHGTCVDRRGGVARRRPGRTPQSSMPARPSAATHHRQAHTAVAIGNRTCNPDESLGHPVVHMLTGWGRAAQIAMLFVTTPAFDREWPPPEAGFTGTG